MMKQAMSRVLPFLLLFCILLPVTACGKGKQGDHAETKPPVNSSGSSENLNDPKLEAVNYNTDFTILERSNEGGYTYEEFAVEESSENHINQSVYERNMMLEDKYNIDIQVDMEPRDTIATTVYQLIYADLATFDMINAGLTYMFNMARNGLLVPVSEIPVIDTGKPYWFQDVISAASVNGESYLLASDANLWVLHSVGAVMFNKQMVSNLGIESPYALVEKNEWTYGTMAELTSVAALENGDGEWNEKDRYGCVSTYAAIETMFTGMGGVLVSKDDADNMSIDYLSERNIDIITKIIDYWADTSKTLFINRWPFYTSPNNSNMMADVFNAGNALFVTEMMYQLPTLVDNGFVVGIVPTPKYDSDQQDYHSFIHYVHATACGVPTSVKKNGRLEMVGRIMEDMAWFSSTTVRRAYYDDNLKLRRACDEETYRMLDIIYGNLRVDTGMILAGAGFQADQKMRDLVYAGKSDNVVSEMNSVYSSDLAILQELIDHYFNTEQTAP